MKHLLFVCRKNHSRSRTFEAYFRTHYRNKYQVISAGIWAMPGRHQLDEKLLKWADKVYVMDTDESVFITINFPQYMNKVKVLNIPDIYDFGEPRLITIVKSFVKKEDL